MVVTKVLPVLALSVLAYCENNRYATHIALGLVVSSLGDISLEFSDDISACFILGMVFFLIAHVFYSSAYILSQIDFSSRWRSVTLFAVLFAGYYAFMMQLLLPSVEGVLIPAILIYGAVICTMAFLACKRYCTLTLNVPTRTTALIGSLVFLSSDSMLSINLFHGSFPGANFLIMLTYYIGQTFIAMSSKDPLPEPAPPSVDLSFSFVENNLPSSRSPLLSQSYSPLLASPTNVSLQTTQRTWQHSGIHA